LPYLCRESLSDVCRLLRPGWLAKSVKGRGRARTAILRNAGKLNGYGNGILAADTPCAELEGSPAALKRVERLERLYFERLIASDPDRPDLMQFNLVNYRGVLESLRKLEKEISLARRDISQLIPKQQAIQGCIAVATFTRMAIMKWIGAYLPELLTQPDARSAKAYFLKTMAESIQMTLTDGMDAKLAVPPWSLDIIRTELARG
jgi:hypothetical protein